MKKKDAKEVIKNLKCSLPQAVKWLKENNDVDDVCFRKGMEIDRVGFAEDVA